MVKSNKDKKDTEDILNALCRAVSGNQQIDDMKKDIEKLNARMSDIDNSDYQLEKDIKNIKGIIKTLQDDDEKDKRSATKAIWFVISAIVSYVISYLFSKFQR